MLDVSLKGENLSKYFIRKRYIFRDINVELGNGEILAVTGENGSGKTTFLKILAGILKPTYGNLNLNLDGTAINNDEIRDYISFVAPYLVLYEEFTPLEHVKIINKIRGFKYNEDKTIKLLKRFNLSSRRYEPIRNFSSGMKQRMKYVLALSCDSNILFLDEPMTNLDSEGVSTVLDTIFEFQQEGGSIVIATNEKRDKSIAKKEIKIK